ncbi:Nischarin, partial [Cathartes aura]
GEQLLMAGEVFTIRPLQLYAVTQQLLQGKPTCANGDAKTDLGHILDFTCRLKYLKVTGTGGPFGTSNIQEHLLPFDLSIFKSLHQIEISHCGGKLIKGLISSKHALATMSVRFSATSMKEILVPEASEFDQWEPEGATSSCPVTAVIPTWRTLTTLDMSHNSISQIDDSVRLIPKIEFLDLSHNGVSLVENLQHLYNLVHLDLSYNKLTSLEGVHTKLGNIKTLNLAGNQLERLCGLNKLYSLVNLDLSNNKIEQIDEVKNIGNLPCLEKVVLSSNPLSIIPDYRTKVLAQFGDRASEVCLDNIVTTEKELDTVEVLKAIQKAKEVKYKLSNSDKKISEDSRLTAASSKSNCSCLTVRPSSPSLPRPVSSSQEIICEETVLASSFLQSSGSTPTDHTVPQRCFEIPDSRCKNQVIAILLFVLCLDLSEEEHCVVPDPCNTFILPFNCMSYTATNQDFIQHLSALIVQTVQRSPPSFTEIKGSDSRTTDKEDGYFEMGLHEGDQTSEFSTTSDTRSSDNIAVESVDIVKILWSFSIHIHKGLRQFASCLVLTDDMLAVFEIPHQELRGNCQHIPSALKLTLCFPYTDLTEFGFLLPEVCLTLKLKTSDNCLFVVSDSQNLQDFYSCLHMCCSQHYTSVLPSSTLYCGKANLREFLCQLMELNCISAEDVEIKGCFPTYLVYGNKTNVQKILHQPESAGNNKEWSKNVLCSALYSSVYKSSDQGPCVVHPCWIFLTPQHLYIVKVDFSLLPGKRVGTEELGSVFKLNRIPLASLVLHPTHGSIQQKGSFLDGHVLELLVGYRFVTAVFVLPHEKFHFLRIYSLLRTLLQDVKTIIVFKASSKSDAVRNHVVEANRHVCVNGCPGLYLSTFFVSVLSLQQNVFSYGRRLSISCACRLLSWQIDSYAQDKSFKPHLTLSSLYPSEFLVQKITEDNQIPVHLPISVSLQYVAGLKGNALIEFFHGSIAEVENEELRHLMWSSVLFYKTPNVEVMACVLLSTKAIYFLLDDSFIHADEHQS